jgi:HPr kinase/phosphorylase
VTDAAHIQIHASCVAFDEGGVLLRGPSGAGKSDLALRLIDRGARLVADDRVDLDRHGGRVRARAPAALAGLMEIRGLGIVRMPFATETEVALVVDLVPRGEVERLPEEQTAKMLGANVRLVALDPFDGSAPLKVTIALRQRVAVDTAQTAA